MLEAIKGEVEGYHVQLGEVGELQRRERGCGPLASHR